MYKVSIFGSGKIGEVIALLLSSSGDYAVKLCDSNPQAAQTAAQGLKNVSAHKIDLSDKAGSLALLKDCDAVVSALPFYCNEAVANLALESNAHYLDLTEDVNVTKTVSKLAKESKKNFIPQSGLAPGFISIAAAGLIRSFDKVESVKMRVGALPMFPNNKLKYYLTWSTEGLINEYCNLCEAIYKGRKLEVLPLEGYETFSLDGEDYEAFNTSGGLGSLTETLQGKVNYLDYKSIRYYGHRDAIAFLLNDLKFSEDRDTLKKVFERSIPTTKQDKCIIWVEATGESKGKLFQRTYASTIYNSYVQERHVGAIQITTAAGVCAPLDLLLTGKIGKRPGLIKSEEIELMDFLNNRFGKYYKDERAIQGMLL